VEASEALVRHVALSRSSQAPEVICVAASVSEHVPLLVERLRGAAPFIRTSSECRSSSSQPSGKRLWVRLGVPVKEADGVFLQSIDYDSSSHCVFHVRKDTSGKWNISINTPCVVS
jgi:hypothetical protein